MISIPRSYRVASKETLSGTPLPPVTQVGVVALSLIVVGGIYLSAEYPRHVSLLLPTALAVAAAILVLFNLLSIIRSKMLARDVFVHIGKWALLAYVIVAGMLEYVFVLDGIRGSGLALFTSMLFIFAIDVPVIIAFTVASFHSQADR